MVTAATKAEYDIVIGGGGMIGTSLALALAPLRLRVALVEPVPPAASAQPSFDDRSTALSRSTQRMYSALGLWDQIRAAAMPITRIHVSDKGRFGFAHIDAAEQGVEALGYVVINRVLGEVLQSARANLDGVDFLCPARITAIRSEPGRIVATVGDADRGRRDIGARLLVVADGANSALRAMLGIAAVQNDYGQHAIVGNLRTDKPLDQCAYERFTAQGPLALLPLHEDRAAFVWTVANAEVDRVLALDDPSFLAELQQAFGYRLGRLSNVGKRAAYPLLLSKASRLTDDRAVLVGNAAHGLHPVAAQGFNLGMRDVAALCDCIADARRADVGSFDPGSVQLLARYADWRRDDQRKLVGFTDGLVRLFGHSSPRVRMLRNLGMLGFDLIPGVRSLFAKHTMGLAGRLPRLSRGVPLR